MNVNLPKNLNNALNISKLNNPKLIMARLDYEITERNLNIEKAKFSPSASINYSKSENRDFSSSVDEMEQESVKASINWPLIKGGKNYF